MQANESPTLKEHSGLVQTTFTCSIGMLTDDQIDLRLLRDLDPDHDSLRKVPARYVSERLGWLVRQGYIVSQAYHPDWMEHKSICRIRYRRSPAGNVRFMELLRQFL